MNSRFRSVREQLSKICSLPTLLGMTAITLFFLMILFANDGRISLSEGTGVGVCVLIMMFFWGRDLPVLPSDTESSMQNAGDQYEECFGKRL